MKNRVTLLAVLIVLTLVKAGPVSADANPGELRACIEQLGKFLDLEEGQLRTLSGETGKLMCVFQMERFYIKAQDRRLLDFTIRVAEDPESDELVSRLGLRIDENQSVIEEDLRECSVQGDVAKVDILLRERSGPYPKTYHNTMEFNKIDGKLSRVRLTESQPLRPGLEDFEECFF